MTLPRKIPVLLLAGPDAALLDTVAARLADALPSASRVAVLRNGMPPVERMAREDEAAAAASFVRDAGAACACCVGEVAARVALARVLREGLAMGGWQRLFVLSGPGAHASRIAALLGGDAASGEAVGRRGVTPRAFAADVLAPPRRIAVLPVGFLERLGDVAPAVRPVVVDLLECAEAWLVVARDGGASPVGTAESAGLEAKARQRPLITWANLVALAHDLGTSLASSCSEGGSAT